MSRLNKQTLGPTLLKFESSNNPRVESPIFKCCAPSTTPERKNKEPLEVPGVEPAALVAVGDIFAAAEPAKGRVRLLAGDEARGE